jgi:CMP-N,N'-diacetyllegionaminic acid synthase
LATCEAARDGGPPLIDMKALCIIPARGGSKSLPKKNLAVVADKPLIAWSIEQALACQLLDRVVVSTDSAEIAEVARRCGAEVPFLRPAELATDTAPTEPALIHALNHLADSHGYRPDVVMLLQPTCPVRKPQSLSRALEHMTALRADSLVAVREIHPFLWQDQSAPRALYDFLHRPRRQDVPNDARLYEETGSIYITKTDLLLRTGNRLGGTIALYVMDAEESWDIDSVADMAVAEALLTRMASE